MSCFSSGWSKGAADVDHAVFTHPDRWICVGNAYGCTVVKRA